MRENVATFRQLRSLDGGVGMALDYLTSMATHLGDWETALAAAREKAAIEAARGAPLYRAYGLHVLGGVYLAQGNLDEARALLEEAQALACDGPNRDFAGALLCALAQVAQYADRLDDATALLNAARQHAARPLPAWLDRRTRFIQAQVALRRGESAAARALLQACLAAEHDAQPQLPAQFEALARAWLGLGEPTRAAILLGAANALRQTMGCPVLPVDRPAYDAALAALWLGRGQDCPGLLWAAGERMSADESLAYALG